jgi:hypothetical protein
MASEAARSLLEYFRPKETGPGTPGPTGTSGNKIATPMTYRNPASARLVPGHLSEREKPNPRATFFWIASRRMPAS